MSGHIVLTYQVAEVARLWPERQSTKLWRVRLLQAETRYDATIFGTMANSA
jgi:hypothetical protein